MSVRHGGAQPEVGQILVFLDDERTVAHRVIRRRASGRQASYRTKGDTCLTADPSWVAEDRIVGVVEGVVEGDVIVKRRGLDGRWGAFLAALSRVQGILFSPLRLITDRMAGGQGRR